MCETRLVVFFRISIGAMRYSGIAFSSIILTRQTLCWCVANPEPSRSSRGVFTLAEARNILSAFNYLQTRMSHYSFH